MKIAIDGPSASGKGTLTKLLSEEIGGKYLNTGKLYRVVAFSIDTNGDIIKQAKENSVDFMRFFKEFGDNPAIFSQSNSELTSVISSIPEVRANLLQFQIDFANTYNPVILEGRDIGTNILPDADFKFFVTASTHERATRRFNQEQNNGLNPNFKEILEAITKRDERDLTRTENPLKPANDAVIIDTTTLSIQQSLGEILSKLKR